MWNIIKLLSCVRCTYVIVNGINWWIWFVANEKRHSIGCWMSVDKAWNACMWRDKEARWTWYRLPIICHSIMFNVCAIDDGSILSHTQTYSKWVTLALVLIQFTSLSSLVVGSVSVSAAHSLTLPAYIWNVFFQRLKNHSHYYFIQWVAFKFHFLLWFQKLKSIFYLNMISQTLGITSHVSALAAHY